MRYTIVDGVVVHPFPCEDCDWSSCYVDDNYVTWCVATLVDVRVHLCATHLPYAGSIIQLARVSATLEPGRARAL